MIFELKRFTNVQDFLGHSIGAIRNLNSALSAKTMKKGVTEGGESFIVELNPEEDRKKRENLHGQIDKILDDIYEELKHIDKK